MAINPDPCIFCELVHKGNCGPPEPKAKAERKKPASKPQTVAETHVESDVFVSSAPSAVDRWASTAGSYQSEHELAIEALIPIMHDDELAQQGLRRPTQPQIAARVHAWRFARG